MKRANEIGPSRADLVRSAEQHGMLGGCPLRRRGERRGAAGRSAALLTPRSILRRISRTPSISASGRGGQPLM